MTLDGVMAVKLRYFTEFGKPALQKTICGGIYARVYCIFNGVQCRRKESSRSLSHLLMSLLSLISYSKVLCSALTVIKQLSVMSLQTEILGQADHVGAKSPISVDIRS